MTLEEIEKELERGIFEFKSDDDDIDPQYLAEWAEEYGKKLLAVAKAAKAHKIAHLDGPDYMAKEILNLILALEELEKE